MNFAKLTAAYGVLFCITLFLSANTKILDSGSGYIPLGLSVLCALFLFIVSSDISLPRRFRKSIIPLAIFLAWFALKYTFESENPYDTRQVLFGTTTGVFFALILGLISAYSLSAIYKLRLARQTHQPAFVVGMVYLAIVLLLGIDSLQAHLSGARWDVFLIEDNKGYYQRAGNFIFIQFMLVTATCIVLLITSSNRVKLIKYFPLLGAILALAGIYGFMSQLIGSNSGLATTVGFALIFFAYFFLMYRNIGFGLDVGSEVRSALRGELKLSSLFVGKLGRKLMLSALVASGLFVAFGTLIFVLSDIDAGQLRITGYGTGEVSSVDSRSRIFKNNFVSHFAFAPIFGHTQVDKLVGDHGSYVHSLLSILPHLGIVGFLIFSVAVLMFFQEMVMHANDSRRALSHNKQYALFRVLALVIVLACGVASAYYIWPPLWYSIGLFGISWREVGR